VKRYQIALLFFAFGIFTVTTLVVLLGRGRVENVPVVQEPEQEFRTLDVYFSNTTNDPGMSDCSRVYPVERVLQRLADNEKSALGEFAYLVVNDLLKGPTDQEKASGFITSINDDSHVQSIIIEGGVAYVDFDSRFNEGVAGSCRVEAIRSQVEKTLRQFSEVNEVVISVDGESDEILQP